MPAIVDKFETKFTLLDVPVPKRHRIGKPFIYFFKVRRLEYVTNYSFLRILRNLSNLCNLHSFKAFERANSSKEARCVERKFMDLQHYNALSHKAIIMDEFLAKN